ncbi:ABC transporter ATP-binding protein [Micromonospora sp. NPDC050187]|uniref:ABC transporter ATP-binding protein n=1 Tax=Micromonospora sp. NPDC050187 TaxID=3364277 RepID=UPI00379FFB10
MTGRTDGTVVARPGAGVGNGTAAPAQRPVPEDRRPVLRFAVNRLRRHPGAVALLAVTLLGGIGLELLAPVLVRRYIEQEVTRSTAAVVSAGLLVAGFVAVSLLARLVTVAEAAVAERLAWTIMDRVRVEVTGHCLALGMDFHTTHRPGELVERVDGDVGLLANFLSRFALAVVGQALLLVGLVGALVVVDWRIGGSVAVVAVVATLVLRRLARRGQQSFTRFRQASGELSGFLGEALGAVPDMAGAGAGGYVDRRLRHATGRVFRTEQAAGIWGSIVLWAAASLFAWTGTAVALAWSVRLYTTGAMTLGAVYLVFLYSQQMMQPLDQMALQVQDYQAAAACVRRLQALLRIPLPARPTAVRPFPSGRVRIDVQAVRFRYPGTTDDVLHDITFTVPPGQSVGVVGRTGSGKSTLVRVLAGLHEPTGGAVLLGGVDATRLDPAGRRRRITVVSQEVQVFRATVRENVTVFDPDVPEERIRTAFGRLGLDDWLARLPQGLETTIGPGGHGLSAGEQQLVSFVRAMLADPAVVLLDEASSRLDPLTERLVQGATAGLLAGRASLVVAHRLATLDRVDRILHLADGRVVEYGRREDLVRDPDSGFSRLLASDDSGLTG